MAGTLYYGCRGAEVQRLQEQLNKRLRPSPGLKVDGVFGPRTEAAVRRYQTLTGIGVDGVVGASTWDALDRRGMGAQEKTIVIEKGNVEKLQAACTDAYIKYPNSCSHAVWHVIKQYFPAQPYMTANALIHHITADRHRWQEVNLYELSQLANEGVLVVGGAVDTPNGHVIVVYPGKEKHSGGYYFKDKISGKQTKASASGVYPLAMSTSMGTWPGAKSNGDKTVLDPWGEKKFNNVRFWRYVEN